MKSGNVDFLEPYGPHQACNGTALPLPLCNFLRKYFNTITFRLLIINIMYELPTPPFFWGGVTHESAYA